jgi:hypothetical protein
MVGLPLPTIEVPSTPPTRRPGLLDAAVGPLAMDDPHMRTAGGQWESESCTKSRLYPTACRDVPYDQFVYDAREGFRTIYAYNVFASEVCPPVGTSLQEAHRRVRSRLELGFQTAVETAFWGSTTANVAGVIQQLNTAALVTTTAAAANPVEAVSLLEQQAADLGDGPIFIHARPRMAAYLGKNGLLDAGPFSPSVPASARDLKRTHMGSTVVFGGGYKGTSPDNATAPDATKEYMLATGRVFIWASDVVDAPPDGVDSTLNRTTNQRAVFAYRSVGISVECYVAATQVTR